MGWIFESIIEVMISIVSGLIGFFLTTFGNFGFDIGYNGLTRFGDLVKPDYYQNAVGLLDRIFPVAGNFLPLFMYVGLGLVFVILIFNVFKAMTDASGKKSEHPFKTVALSVAAGVGVIYSYSIFVCIERIAQLFYTPFQNLFQKIISLGLPDIVGYLASPDALFKDQGAISKQVNGLVISIVALVLFSAMLIQFVRLLLEVFERYIVLGVMFYTSPLAFSTLASGSTIKIFENWLQMLVSQFLLMALNIFFLGMFYVGYITVFAPADPTLVGTLQSVLNIVGLDTKSTYVFENGADFICKMFILIGWLTVGQKTDQFLRSLGLSVSQTGAGLGTAILGGVMSAKSLINGGEKAIKGIDHFNHKMADGRRRAAGYDVPSNDNTRYGPGVTNQAVSDSLSCDDRGRLDSDGVHSVMFSPSLNDGTPVRFSGSDGRQTYETLKSDFGESVSPDVASATAYDGRVCAFGNEGNTVDEIGDNQRWYATTANGDDAAHINVGDYVKPLYQDDINKDTLAMNKDLADINTSKSVLGDYADNVASIKPEYTIGPGGSKIETGTYTGLDSNNKEVFRLVPDKGTTIDGKEYLTGTSTYYVGDKAVAQAALNPVAKIDPKRGETKIASASLNGTKDTYSVQNLETYGCNYQNNPGYADVKLPAAGLSRKPEALPIVHQVQTSGNGDNPQTAGGLDVYKWLGGIANSVLGDPKRK